MSIDIFNPDDSKEIAEEAHDSVLKPFRTATVKAPIRSTNHLYGYVLFSGERQMPVGPLVSTSTFEYELIRSIRVLTSDPNQIKTIGYLISEGEPDLQTKRSHLSVSFATALKNNTALNPSRSVDPKIH